MEVPAAGVHVGHRQHRPLVAHLSIVLGGQQVGTGSARAEEDLGVLEDLLAAGQLAGEPGILAVEGGPGGTDGTPQTAGRPLQARQLDVGDLQPPHQRRQAGQIDRGAVAGGGHGIHPVEQGYPDPGRALDVRGEVEHALALGADQGHGSQHVEGR